MWAIGSIELIVFPFDMDDMVSRKSVIKFVRNSQINCSKTRRFELHKYTVVASPRNKRKNIRTIVPFPFPLDFYSMFTTHKHVMTNRLITPFQPRYMGVMIGVLLNSSLNFWLTDSRTSSDLFDVCWKNSIEHAKISIRSCELGLCNGFPYRLGINYTYLPHRRTSVRERISL